MLLGFLGFLFLIRILDKDNFGIWVIYVTVSGFLETIRLGFIKNPLLIFSSKPAADNNGLNNSSFVLNIGFSIAAALLILLTTWLINGFIAQDAISTLIYFYLIKLLFISIADHFDIVQESNKEFKGTFLDLTFRNFVFVVCVGICYFNKMNLPLHAFVVFQILGVVVGALLSYRNMLVKHINAFSPPGFNFTLSRELLSFGKFTFGSSVSSILMRNIDSWSLAILINPAAVAVYNPAIRISNLFEIPASTSTTILLPKLIEKIRDKELRYIKLYYENSMVYILALMIPFVLIVFNFSDEIIFIVAGKGYDESADLLKFTVFYGLLIPFQRQCAITLDAIGRPGLNFIILTFGLITCIVLNVYFISQFGTVGATYAMLVTFFLVFIAMQTYLYRNFNINLFGIGMGVFRFYIETIIKAFQYLNKSR